MSRYKYKDMTGKPHNCEDCIHNDKQWYELPCDACCTAHSGYEGRYIDAYNLMKALEEAIPITDNPIEVMASVIATLEEQPTADVRENVRGEWIEVEVFPEVYDIEGIKTWGSEMQCDQCGFRHTAVERHMTQYNFCPNCGAEMRPISALSENVEIVSNLKRGES